MNALSGRDTPGCDHRVLVTGAGGFIGSHVAADQARRGHVVVALDRELDAVGHLASMGRFELVRGDIADAEVRAAALRDVQTVFHLAAVHLSVSATETEFQRTNVMATRELAELAVALGVRRFVHVSTAGVYGRIKEPPADEKTECRPEIAYERTKLAGETVVREVAERSGMELVILRPVWVYGPGCHRTEKLLRAVSRNRFVMGGRGDRLRHSVYIRDMVEACHLSANAARASGETLVIGDDRAVSVRELLETVASITGARPPRRAPLALLWLGGFLAETVFRVLPGEPPLSRRTLKFFTGNSSFDTRRARELLGFSPRYDLRRGIAETYDILRENEEWQVPLPEVESVVTS